MKKNITPKGKSLRAVETLDLAAEQRQCEQAAQYIKGMLTIEKMPNFVLFAVVRALIAASRIHNINLWPEGYDKGTDISPEALADLFVMTQGKFTLDKSPEAELAAHISAILKHPKTPTALFNALGEAVCILSNNVDNDTAEFIEYVLSYNLRAESGNA